MQKGYFITEQELQEFKKHLVMEEKSKVTISKYICDIKKLLKYDGKRSITKELVIAYKRDLRVLKRYKLSSINSFLVTRIYIKPTCNEYRRYIDIMELV